MKSGKTLTKIGITTAGLLLVLLAVKSYQFPESETAMEPVAPTLSTGQELKESQPESEHPNEPQIKQNPVATGLPGWINNNGQFTEEIVEVLSWVESGQPLDIRIDGGSARRYAFQETRVTSDEFQISTGPSSIMPSEYRIYAGRELGPEGLGERASLALVNGALSMAVTRDGVDYLIETDPGTGELYAVALHSFDNEHSCGGTGCETQHTFCQISADGKIASVRAPQGVGENPPRRVPVDILYPEDQLGVDVDMEASVEPQFESGTAGKPYLRNGPEYDASLKDILVLMISAKSQTGATSGLSSKAATYFAITARAAEIYERQLGLRYMLQELVLIPSDTSQADPGTVSTTLGDDLNHLQSWINANRPQSTYKWGHAALWTLVDGGSGGVIGLAWTDSYGTASYGHSTQELNWGWGVHIHELGHNVGSSHASGGVMNPSIISGNENFFTTVSGTNYTSATDIYNYMVNRSYVFGPAALRNPVEIPFGVDDTLSTAAGSPVTFDAIANDNTSVPYGATNNLRLVEVGQVYPKAAGSARVVDGLVEFTPASGFTGQAWFTYTVGGDVGNNGKGWLHRADVVVTVGGNSTAPSSTPALSLSNDFISSELTSAVRFNPLLNDEGSGHLWAGDVDVVLSPSDTSPESYSYDSMWLVDATVVTGTGTLTLEKHNMTWGSSGGNLENSGYVTYTPGASESGEVVIEYTVEDASGNTASAYVYLAQLPSVSIAANYLTTAEDSGDVLEFTFNRSASADTSVDEIISFTVSGTTTPAGLTPDYALAGQQSFDPITGAGTVVIPAGQLTQTVLMAIENDGVTEGQETMILNITGSSSLLVSESGSSITLWINDNSQVYSESFDSFSTDSATWNGWTNLKDKNSSGKGGEDFFDWTLDSGSTPTSGTGPSADHTSGTGKYFLAEASSHSNEYTILQSALINTNGVGAGNLEFYYHMLGSSMGSLTVELYANGTLVASNLFSAAGQQSSNGTDWKKAFINLDSYLPAQSLQLRFRADIGSGDLSDIAIDDVSITAQSSSLPQSPDILADPAGCTVEAGQSVYLSVIPQGFPVPQVQWYKDGVAIPGACGAAYYISAMDESTAGTYEASVTNSEGTVISFPAAVRMPSLPPSANPNYNEWAQAFVNAAAWSEDDWSENSDPDGDGIINSLEYAFGMNPTAASRSGMPAVGKKSDQGEQYLEMTYIRRKNDPNVTYTVETSANLSANGWVSGPGVVQEISAVDDGTGEFETVTVRRVTSLGNGPGFMRINVVMTDPGS